MQRDIIKDEVNISESTIHQKQKLEISSIVVLHFFGFQSNILNSTDVFIVCS